jgi:hypothetical protein
MSSEPVTRLVNHDTVQVVVGVGQVLLATSTLVHAHAENSLGLPLVYAPGAYYLVCVLSPGWGVVSSVAATDATYQFDTFHYLTFLL